MFTDISDIPVYYERCGAGLPLICIHGYGVDHRSLKAGMEDASDGIDGFERIYFDLPGMGQSGAGNAILSSDDMLEVTFQFIDDVIGPDQPFALAGYSYGGYLARGVLARIPERVRGMMLLCPVIRFRRQNRRLPEFVCCERDQAFIDSLSPAQFAALDQFVTIQTPEVWDLYRRYIHPSLTLSDSVLMTRIRDTELSVDPDAADIPVYPGPALVLLGRYDVSVGYEDAWKIHHRFPDGDFVVLGRAGHLLHMEQPGMFRTHVRAWLDRVDTDTAAVSG
ncbi:MAG TPA: 2-hydroxy-6-oxo-6-phenylhexa-2,4-dienoate hydrolase [Desulfobacteraceae bacterium]|nr:2-hydroxy-6-oxo-6-phenylhexa-2,4-dienoate hydrolase [Desulfobacteraceae bacterium]